MFKFTPRAIVVASIIAFLGYIPTTYAQTPNTAPAPQQSNPWDKYDAVGSPKNVPSSKANDITATSNPWDKYDTSDIRDAVPHVNTDSSASNPWDKYNTDKVPSVPFAPNTPSETELKDGANPWDKYTPAAMPKAQVKKNKDGKKVNARPKNLPLAELLPERKVPTGDKKVFANIPVGKNYYYAIKYGDQLIGYSEFSVGNEIVLDGRASYLLNSSSRVKVGTDNISDLRYYTKMQFYKRDLSPASLICSQKSTQNDYKITCIYSPGVIAQSNTFNEQTNSYVHQFEQPTANLTFNNLWGKMDTFAEHYWLLVLSAFKGGTVDVYDPILRTDGKVTVYAPVTEKWTNNKKSYNTLVYAISDLYGSPLAKVRLDSNTKELLEIKEIGNGISFSLSNAGVAKQVDKINGINLWPSKVRLSNIYFSDPNKLTHLEADVEMELRGGQLVQHSITGYEQKTYGELKEGKISGRIVVDAKPANVRQNAKFPYDGEFSEEVKEYLKFNIRSEANDTAIYNKANALTWRSGTMYQAARRLTGYIANNIENGISLPSALQTLEHGVGNAESKALLLVNMARSVNIPARCVGGLVYQRGEFIPHYWAELWMGPEAKWMAFDPSTNESGHINASHIILWENGDVQDLQITVEKFAPHPQRQVPFFSEKMRWPIGEKRTFAIVSSGKRVGTEIAHLRDLELVDNRESYNFHAVTNLFAEPQDMPNLEPKEENSSEGEDTTSQQTDTSDSAGDTIPVNDADLSEPSASAQDTASAHSSDIEVKPSVVNLAPDTANATESQSTTPQGVATPEAGKAEGQANEEQNATPKIAISNICDVLYNSYALPMRSNVKIAANTPNSKEINLRFKNNRVYEDIVINGETVEREIPVSNGLYLADQRFLSQWILAVEQIPLDKEQEDQEPGNYSIHIFVPGTLSSQELLLSEDEEGIEVIMPDGNTVTTTCLRSEKGIEFYLDENRHVVKMAIPNNNLELYLESSEFSLE